MELSEREKELAGLTTRQRMMARLQDANDFRHEQENRAHERFMERRRNFIEANPNAVSPWERKAVLEENRTLQEKQGLRAHELAMLGQQGANARGIEAEKNKGAMGVARINADAAHQNAVLEWEKRGEMNALDNETRKDISRIEQDGMSERNRDTNDTHIAVEEQKGQNAIDLAKQQGKDARIEGIQRQLGAERIAQIQAGAEAATAQRSAEVEQEKRIDDMVKVLMNKDQYKDLPADQVRVEAMRRLGIGASGLGKFRK